MDSDALNDLFETMRDDTKAINELFNQFKKLHHEDQEKIKKLIDHVRDLRHLVLELSEGLEYPSLQEQVNKVMGPIFDIENEDDENEDDD